MVDDSFIIITNNKKIITTIMLHNGEDLAQPIKIINVKNLINFNTMLRTIKSYVKKLQISNLLAVELILLNAHHGIQCFH
jgi:hypothetical protein